MLGMREHGSAPRPVLIVGPTASGKSGLALEIAERDGGWIVNADALQVYACWRVLTARPGAADCRRVPHHLYGHVGCDRSHSVGAWLRDVARVLAEARSAGARPIVVGGTGLYLSALTEGLVDVPRIPAEIRARSEALIADGRIAQMLDDLARGDPSMHARMDRDNPRRVQRAWEVLVATGRALSDWQRMPTAPLVPADQAIRIVVQPDPAASGRRIDARFRAMLSAGALDECARFRELGGDLASPAGRALGAADLIAYLDGRIGLDQATEAAIAATRQYARRQRMWFRKRMTNWQMLDPNDGALLARLPRD